LRPAVRPNEIRDGSRWPELTGLEEDGEAEVDGLERRVLLLVGEEEVLGLEVPVDHAVAVAELHDLDDGAGDRGRRALRVVAPGDDAVEQLPSLAELHDEVHGAVVLARLPQGHDAGALGQVPHDGHLPPHVLHVHGRPQLPLGDGLAGQQLPRAPVHAQVRHPELAAPELPVQRVLLLDPGAHVAPFLPEHRQPLLLPGAAPASGAVPRLVGLLLPAACGGREVRRLDVFPRRGGRRAAAVSHGCCRARLGVGALGFARHWALCEWGRSQEEREEGGARERSS